MRYIEQSPDRAQDICRAICSGPVPAILVTRGQAPPDPLLKVARAAGVPILITPRNTAEAIGIVLHHLAVHLAPRVRVHGVLVDVYGLGILILGESGIGKSECALELVARGHRLVADDSVEIRLIEDQLIGGAPPISRHHMEVRGLGIMNAFEMFGVTAVRDSILVEQVVRLVRFDPERPFDRLGSDTASWEALGRSLSLYEIPVAPGRNLAVLLEVAARRRLLLRHGRDAARDLREMLAHRILENTPRESQGDR
ncbi:MAG: HPr(Ser) kinase/phosphatase [Acidobacteria bacterium]|nr:HPr(Ser) kinase/phosphatase [Acidobacteriota bacterium]